MPRGRPKKEPEIKQEIDLITEPDSESNPPKDIESGFSDVNNLCKKCTQKCKQYKQIIIIHCPNIIRKPEVVEEIIAEETNTDF